MDINVTVNNISILLEQVQKEVNGIFTTVKSNYRVIDQKWNILLPRFWNYLISNFRNILEKWVLKVYDINKGHAGIEPKEIVDWIINSIYISENKIIIDFNLSGLNPITSQGKPLFKIKGSGSFRETGEQRVRNANEQWQLPINGMKEDDFYFENSLKELSDFIKKDFTKYIIQQLRQTI